MRVKIAAAVVAVGLALLLGGPVVEPTAALQYRASTSVADTLDLGEPMGFVTLYSDGGAFGYRLLGYSDNASADVSDSLTADAGDVRNINLREQGKACRFIAVYPAAANEVVVEAY